MAAVTFEPWEFPSGGQPPELALRYGQDPGTGERFVVNASAWMLLIKAPDGTCRPLTRTASYLAPGEEVLPPAPHVGRIDVDAARDIQWRAHRECDLRHLPKRGDDGEWVDNPEETYRWWWRRVLPHGRLLQLLPGSFGNPLLIIGPNDGINIEGNWYYGDHDAAWQAVLGWNGEGDPPDGWIRHLETARRRKDGTAATEYYNAAEAPDWLRLQHTRAGRR